MRMIPSILAVAIAATSVPAFASASCPSMGAYSVTGVTAENLPLQQALDVLFDSTAWNGTVKDGAADVRVSLRNVGGPLDLVFQKVMDQARTASGQALSTRTDRVSCEVTISPLQRPTGPVAMSSLMEGQVNLQDVQLAPVPAPMPVVPREVDRLIAGQYLSSALTQYAEKEGWKVRWMIPTEYMLDVDVQLPKADFKENVIWLVETYQMQGGLLGTRPRFASNRVVVIEAMRPDGGEL